MKVDVQARTPKGWTLENPLTGDQFGHRFMVEAIDVEEVRAVIKPQTPPGTPSVTWELRYGADRTAAGTLIAGATTTNTTTGATATITNASVPAGNYIWLDITTATTGLDAPEAFDVELTGSAK